MKGGGKTLIMILGVLAMLGFGYLSFFNKPNDDIPSEGDIPLGGVPNEEHVGMELIALLDQLKTLRMDDSLFTSPSFATLRDYTLPVADMPRGRNNPFAPIGQDTLFIPTASIATIVSASTTPVAPPSAGGSNPATTTVTR